MLKGCISNNACACAPRRLDQSPGRERTLAALRQVGSLAHLDYRDPGMQALSTVVCSAPCVPIHDMTRGRGRFHNEAFHILPMPPIRQPLLERAAGYVIGDYVVTSRPKGQLPPPIRDRCHVMQIKQPGVRNPCSFDDDNASIPVSESLYFGSDAQPQISTKSK